MSHGIWSMPYWKGYLINMGSPMRMAFLHSLCLWHFNLSVNKGESSVLQKWKVPMLPVVNGKKVRLWKTHFCISSCTSTFFFFFWSSLNLKPKEDYSKHTVQPLGRNYLYLDVISYGILNLVILTVPFKYLLAKRHCFL